MTASQGLEKLLKENRCRLTPQRKAVLYALASSGDEHLTAEDVYRLSRKDYQKIGLATVYRTLELFVKLGVAQRFVLDDGCARYELKTDIPHHHLICLSCGKIFEADLDMPRLSSFQDSSDFKVTSSTVHFFGYCKECRQEHDKRKNKLPEDDHRRGN
ncbi:MAG: Fur family transcriptional regulator [Dethiobacteria bacterium]|jgi:Fur family ferric uptake transcriptional regulator